MGYSLHEIAAKDDVDYEIQKLVLTIPIVCTYCQNFEFSGFISILEQIYQSFIKINPHIRSTRKESGQNDIYAGQWANDLFSEDTLIPSPIADYTA